MKTECLLNAHMIYEPEDKCVLCDKTMLDMTYSELQQLLTRMEEVRIHFEKELAEYNSYAKKYASQDFWKAGLGVCQHRVKHINAAIALARKLLSYNNETDTANVAYLAEYNRVKILNDICKKDGHRKSGCGVAGLADNVWYSCSRCGVSLLE